MTQIRSPLANLLTAGVWLLAGACGPGVATPMPEPPTVFDLSQVGGPTQEPALEGQGPAMIYGAPGSVPAFATVRVTNLDLPVAAAASDARDDGSFNVPVTVENGQELRFDWIQGDQRSEPADALFVQPDPAQPGFTLELSPRFDCLTLTPGYLLELEADGSVTLSLTSSCDSEVTLDNARSRIGLTDFTLQTALPLSLAPGDSTELTIDFSRSTAGFREDTLLVDVTLGAETIRYPITLRAP
jgi:hypothetical protein